MNTICLFITALVAFSISPTFAQKSDSKTKVVSVNVQEKALKLAVERAPNSLRSHEAYIKMAGLENPALETQYKSWMKKFPKSHIIPYALGKAYSDRELPKARTYLLKAATLNAGFDKAWSELSYEASLRGDEAAARTYIYKAVLAAPNNADYFFRYANSYKDFDNEKYRRLSLDLVKRFPKEEAAARALYFLASEAADLDEKLSYFQMLKEKYNPVKYQVSAHGMFLYYDLLIPIKPSEAVNLAEYMAKNSDDQKEWHDLAIQAVCVKNALEAMAQNRPKDALEQLANVRFARYHDLDCDLALMKAKANHLAGNTLLAYQSLIETFAKMPQLKLHNEIYRYGAILNKDKLSSKADVWSVLERDVKKATPFSLKQYSQQGLGSLEDYKGKVVLLTYWFPGCGPCRSEFPHFENVVRKFKDKELAYLGINIVSDQNEYVLPFIKKTGFSFIPLEDYRGRIKGNLDNRGGAPMNFLIDKDGRLIFSDFRTDAGSEEDLELMISLLIEN